MYQNEFTGDLSDLACVASFTGHNGSNWIKGRLLDQKLDVSFEVKVFAKRSCHGIYEGRMSKLFMYKGKEWTCDWDTCLVNFERGWDIEPHSPEAMDALDIMLRAIDGFEGYIKDGANHA